MAKGKARMMFPGGNTYMGFYSFYDYIMDKEEATRIFIVKGGPGVGKSTFMKRIGENMMERGYDVEFHWCSSDNSSLDALVIPEIKVALIDGTAPHVVDPVNPGAVDEIINLGEFWDESKMCLHRDEIVAENQRVGRHFQTAYSCLKMAKLVREEEKGYRSEGIDVEAFSRLEGSIITEVFGERMPWGSGKNYRDRHLFSSAITPEGIVHYLPSLLEGVKKLIVVKGEPGSGSDDVLLDVAFLAFRCGYYCESYHCAFDPAQVDLVVVPQNQTAVLKLVPELSFDPSSVTGIDVYMEYDFNSCTDKGTVDLYQEELAFAQESFKRFLDRAVKYLKKAKAAHDEMEKYYIDSMNFEGIEKKRQEILSRILAYVNL